MKDSTGAEVEKVNKKSYVLGDDEMPEYVEKYVGEMEEQEQTTFTLSIADRQGECTLDLTLHSLILEQGMEKVVRLKKEGAEAFKDKDFHGAVAKFKIALNEAKRSFKEDNPEENKLRMALYLNCANSFIQTKDFTASASHAAGAIKIDPTYPKGYFIKGVKQ